MKRVLNQTDGLTEFFHYKDGKYSLEIVQDIEPILERNKKLQNEAFNKKADFWYAGTVPDVVWIGWCKEAGVDLTDGKAVGEVIKKKLNDPDFRAFRTGVFKY